MNKKDIPRKIRELDGRRMQSRYGEVLVEVHPYVIGDGPSINFRDLETGEPIARLTVNEPEVQLAPDEVLVKTWSENEEISRDAMKTGWFEDTGRRILVGYVEAQVWRVK